MNPIDEIFRRIFESSVEEYACLKCGKEWGQKRGTAMGACPDCGSPPRDVLAPGCNCQGCRMMKDSIRHHKPEAAGIFAPSRREQDGGSLFDELGVRAHGNVCRQCHYCRGRPIGVAQAEAAKEKG